ncbi:MAG: ATP-binding protein [Muribaculaceae bacterium]|nr:ATP-binding protein [Muribaculaceae bacterium]
MERKHFPVGIETFQKIRETGLVYIDKTEYIHRLTKNGGFYFLSRPRRFGKSLLLSTLEAFYEGKKELFKGLDITRYGYSWEPHPIFRFNFVNCDTSSANGVNALLEQHISLWEEKYGASDKSLPYAQRFFGVIEKAVKQTGRQAIVLIDEYDKPLIGTLEDSVLNNKFRTILKPLYGTLKAADRYIRLALLTGVSRFSRLSIFSDINNLRDISFDNNFNAICGITEEEMLRDCNNGINYIALNNRLTFDEAVEALKKDYDGYHFTSRCPDIYNPFSLMSAFERGETGSYWFATGTPTFLIKSLRATGRYLPELLNSEATEAELGDIDSYGFAPISLLFQTGYLTIKGYDKVFNTYILGFPNREVVQGFFNDLLPIFMDEQYDTAQRSVREFCRTVMEGNPEKFINQLQSFLAAIPYDLSANKPEIYFENNIYIIFSLMGFTVETEYRTSSGRIDLLVKTRDFIYVIELKLNGTAEDALAQINDKQYTLPFAHDPRKLFKIGISFSHKTRNIDSWIIS